MEIRGPQQVPPIEKRGDRIRRLRKERGFRTQAALGEAVGVGELAAGDWEREKYAPSGENLVKLADVLNVPPHYILYGEAGVYREAVEEIAAIVERVLNPPGPTPQELVADAPPDEEGDASSRLIQ